MKELICPVCAESLRRLGGVYKCDSNHSFDVSAAGYVNLLLPNQMHAKVPGDSKAMVAARRSFLGKGYYAPLSEGLNQAVYHYLKGIAYPRIIDAGCGEGYYTGSLSAHLGEQGQPHRMIGFDISKYALAAAAKRYQEITFGVASLFHMPVADGLADLVLNLFAPLCPEEFWRVLKPEGILAIVAPGERHLWGLKSALYEQPYPNELSDTAIKGFRLLEQRSIVGEITLDNTQDILDLFSMTPYYWKTSKEAAEGLARLSTLDTPISFELLLYQKEATQ